MFQWKNPAVRRAYFAILFEGLGASSASVLLPLLRQHYALPYDIAGLLLAFLSVGNLLAALLLGVLAHWWGLRRAMLLLTSGMMVGYLLIAGSGLPALLLAGFLCIGMGKGSSMNYASVLVGNAASDRTRSLTLLHGMFALGSLCAPVLYMVCTMDTLPWFAPVLALAATGAILWGLFAATGVGKNAASQKEPQKQELGFLRSRHFWLSVAMLFCQQCSEIGVTSWVVTYFKDQGILQGILSQFTVTVVWGAMLLARLLIAFVLPAKSRLCSMIFMCGASLAAYALMMTANSGIAAVGMLFVFGLVEAGVYPAVTAQASRGLNNAVLSVLMPIGGIGAIVMPYIIGAVAQAAGIRAGMLCPLAALAGMLVFAILLQIETRAAPAGK